MYTCIEKEWMNKSTKLMRRRSIGSIHLGQLFTIVSDKLGDQSNNWNNVIMHENVSSVNIMENPPLIELKIHHLLE